MGFYRVFLRSPVCEKLICHTINPLQAHRIEPQPECYFVSVEDAEEIPSGVYYFTQIQKHSLQDNELLEAAIEMQKEALWNRYKPGEKLYIRKLFEDNSAVTQLWRPVITPSIT